MREGSITASFLVASLAAAVSACSFFVGTSGLTGGTNPDGGGSDEQPSSGSGGATSSGVDLGEAGPAPLDAGVVADAGALASVDASPSPPDDAGNWISPISEAGAHDSGVVADAGPPSQCSLGHARVFLTSTLYDGDFGGVTGADADCTARATSQGLGGTWRAWMSDTATPAFDHIYTSSGGYVLLDGTTVATSFNALISGSLAHAIDLTELNAPISDGQTEVWTGVDVTGQMGSQGFCSDGSGHDWSSSDSGAPTPLVGHSNATDSTWSAAYLQFCDRTNVRLYCFEVCK